MGAVIPIATPTDAEAAWDAFQRHAAKAHDNPALVADPAHIAESARLHAVFMEAFDQPSNVIPFRRRKA